MPQITIVETDETPRCPHCNKALTTIERVSKGIIELVRVFICPHCKKVLSIGYDRWWG